MSHVTLKDGESMELVIVVRDGRVESLYADGDINVEVIDFDTTNPERQKEAEEDLQYFLSDYTFREIIV